MYSNMSLIFFTRQFLSFGDKVAYVYNPLEYASAPHAYYVSKYCGTKTVLFLGMNPGPFGMAQNGVQFLH